MAGQALAHTPQVVRDAEEEAPWMRRRPWAEPAVVLGLTALALAIRLYRLPDLPPGLYNDEAANGVDILHLLQGHYYPIFFAANTGREPLFIYLQAIIVGLLGATPWSLRLTSAILGAATVPAVYWLARETFAGSGVNARWLAFWTALFLALSYWHVNFSRIGLRVIMLPLLACLTFAWFWRAWHRLGQNRRLPWVDLIMCGAFLGASLYTYIASRLLPVLLILVVGAGLVLGRRRPAAWRYQVLASLAVILAVALLVFAPLGRYYASHPDSFWQHSSDVSLLNPSVNGGRPLSALGQSLIRTAGMFGVWADAWWRHNPAQRPAFDPLLALWLVAGVALALLRRRELPYLFLLAWLGLLAVPAILSEEAPHFLRTLGLVPAAYMLAVLAMLAMGRRLTGRSAAWLAVWLPLPFLLLSGGYDLHSYFAAPWSDGHMAFNFDVPFGRPVAGMVAHSAPGDLWLEPVWPVSAIPDQRFVADFLGRGQIKASTVLSDEKHAPRQLQTATQGRPLAYLLDWGAQIEPDGSYVLADWKGLLNFLLSKYGRPLPSGVGDQEGTSPAGPGADFTGYAAYSLPITATYQVATTMTPLDLSFAGQVKLTAAAYGHTADGQQVTAASLQEPRVPAGTAAWAVLRWEAQTQLKDNLRVKLYLADRAGRDVARTESPLTSDEYLYTQDWPANEGTSTYHILPIPPGLQPGTYQLLVAVDQVNDKRSYNVTVGTSTSASDAAALLGAIEVTAPEKPAPQYPADLNLGTGIRFLGHDQPTPTVRAGSVLPVTFYWQAQAPITTSYTVFVHLLGPDGRIVAQNDGIPGRGQAPTTDWGAQTFVTDAHALAIPPGALPGTYTLEAGLYEAAGGQRLPVSAGSQAQGDRILLKPQVKVIQ
jgi:4-amino-4-deoxy-L-arabinose transferase-like glycosyltransferase